MTVCKLITFGIFNREREGSHVAFPAVWLAARLVSGILRHLTTVRNPAFPPKYTTTPCKLWRPYFQDKREKALKRVLDTKCIKQVYFFHPHGDVTDGISDRNPFVRVKVQTKTYDWHAKFANTENTEMVSFVQNNVWEASLGLEIKFVKKTLNRCLIHKTIAL